MKENLVLAKKLNIVASVLSAVVLLLVVFMRKIHFETGIDFSFLPPLHATLNGLAAIALMFSFYFIKNKNVEAHKRANVVALLLSTLFLLSYVVYHTTTEATSFGGEGTIRYVYFFLLITHVILAAVILPFILFTFIRAYTGQIDKHRQMAKWVYPLWLYVAITGPLCYLMLRPYY
ncbi:MAG: DUF420 domain-containing protein [Saprospiraceae bacterium]